MFKLKKKKRYCHVEHSLWRGIISADHMTHLHDHPVIHSASTNRRTARRQWSAALWVKSTGSSGYEQWSSGTAGSALQSWRKKTKQEVQSGTCDIFVHLGNLCWHFNSVCTENVLQWRGGKKIYGNSLKNWGKPIFFFFVWFLFSVLIVIVHACLFREEDTLVFLFEM